eukprot:CAMPEP_0179342252 /NCGR_PEP_ID=MMETSP0797-20121207/70303_1 /TAXON_ID=47934 /ORGANISM="Dinophysis acuminata, Strain DAEP01" /LENGTH=562 /DNA_ID=CAMNT_0021056445 /DNA_START=123 /DNA_END=1809 /DNA_ORIENTATION=-
MTGTLMRAPVVARGVAAPSGGGGGGGGGGACGGVSWHRCMLLADHWGRRRQARRHFRFCGHTLVEQRRARSALDDTRRLHQPEPLLAEAEAAHVPGRSPEARAQGRIAVHGAEEAVGRHERYDRALLLPAGDGAGAPADSQVAGPPRLRAVGLRDEDGPAAVALPALLRGRLAGLWRPAHGDALVVVVVSEVCLHDVSHGLLAGREGVPGLEREVVAVAGGVVEQAARAPDGLDHGAALGPAGHGVVLVVVDALVVVVPLPDGALPHPAEQERLPLLPELAVQALRPAVLQEGSSADGVVPLVVHVHPARGQAVPLPDVPDEHVRAEVGRRVRAAEEDEGDARGLRPLVVPVAHALREEEARAEGRDVDVVRAALDARLDGGCGEVGLGAGQVYHNPRALHEALHIPGVLYTPCASKRRGVAELLLQEAEPPSVPARYGPGAAAGEVLRVAREEPHHPRRPEYEDVRGAARAFPAALAPGRAGFSHIPGSDDSLKLESQAGIREGVDLREEGVPALPGYVRGGLLARVAKRDGCFASLTLTISSPPDIRSVTHPAGGPSPAT